MYKQHLSSEDKQVQSNQSAHQGQLAPNLQLTGHPVDWGQVMVTRKIEDKNSRKPLTEAEKVNIINHVRGENGQGKSYRQVSKEIRYPISTISRVVKEWREETVLTRGRTSAPVKSANGKSASTTVGVHHDCKVEHNSNTQRRLLPLID
jgi:hypothetical protein